MGVRQQLRDLLRCVEEECVVVLSVDQARIQSSCTSVTAAFQAIEEGLVGSECLEPLLTGTALLESQVEERDARLGILADEGQHEDLALSCWPQPRKRPASLDDTPLVAAQRSPTLAA